MSKYVRINLKKMEKEKERIKMCKRAVEYIRNTKEISAQEAAEKLFEEYNIELPVPIIKIVKDAGFSVYVQDLPTNIGGYILINSELEKKFNTDKIIVVNEKENNKRRRFTVAHEFGHYLFSFKQGTQFTNAFENDDTKNTPDEVLVNNFAAEFLMPKEVFRKKYDELKQNEISDYDILLTLSEIFLTPLKAIERRIQEVIII